MQGGIAAGIVSANRHTDSEKDTMADMAVAAAPLNDYGVPPCPECGKDDFRAKTAWGLHRKQKHGIVGTSKSAVANRALAAVAPAPAKAPAPQRVNGHAAALSCPECGRSDFKRNADLGKHRLVAHNVAGTSAASLAKQRKKLAQEAAASAIMCDVPGCSEGPFATLRARGSHRRWKHGIAGKAATHTTAASSTAIAKAEAHGSNGKGLVHSGRGTEPNAIAEEAAFQFGRAVGRAEEKIGELCGNLANETGHAPRELTARLTEYLFRSSRRG